jgi:hypothetical protein
MEGACITNDKVLTYSPLCHPERTRISYYAAPEMATCAAFIEESRMKFADPAKLDRKSGEVEGSAVFSVGANVRAFGVHLKGSAARTACCLERAQK